MPHQSRLLLTDEVRRALALTPQLLTHGRFGLIDGPSGAGKSTLLGIIRAACPHRVVHVQLEKGRRGKALDEAIYADLTGTVLTGTERDIERAISVELSRTPTLVIIDEAQYLPPSVLLAMRTLMRDTGHPFGLLFAGIDVERNLRSDAPLWTRFSWQVSLRRLEGHHLHNTLRDYHPLLAAAEPALLSHIDAVLCGGNWRNWGLFIEQHQLVAGRDTPMTHTSADTTLRNCRNLVLARPTP
jgi:hypothetical protein